MSKSTEVELTQLKIALEYFASLLEEGTLVERYDQGTREEIAAVLRLLLSNVANLPDEIPVNLLQAAAVRAVIGASEKFTSVVTEDMQKSIARQMREAEAAASIQGHQLGEWEAVSGSDLEYQATCAECGGFVYISHHDTYNLLPIGCARTQAREKGLG